MPGMRRFGRIVARVEHDARDRLPCRSRRPARSRAAPAPPRSGKDRRLRARRAPACRRGRSGSRSGSRAPKTSIASQAVTILVTEAGTKGSSAFWATNSSPLASTTSTTPDGASAATFSLTPASAGAGSRSKARASRRDHMAAPARLSRPAAEPGEDEHCQSNNKRAKSVVEVGLDGARCVAGHKSRELARGGQPVKRSQTDERQSDDDCHRNYDRYSCPWPSCPCCRHAFLSRTPACPPLVNAMPVPATAGRIRASYCCLKTPASLSGRPA